MSATNGFVTIKGNIYFSTHDTALAAYLVSEGLPYPSIEHTPSRECVFCFPVDGHNKEDYVRYERNHRLGIASGNITIFFKSYKQLLKMVH